MTCRAGLRALALGVAMVCGVASAEAAIITYQYQGLPLIFVEGQPNPEGYPSEREAYSGTMVIDEAQLGKSLSNATVSFESKVPADSSTPKPPGLLEFTLFAFPPAAEGTIEFVTNKKKEIVSFSGSYMDGPPDGGIYMKGDLGGDSYLWDDLWYSSSRPGTWTIVSIEGDALPGCGPSGNRPPKCNDGTAAVPGPIAGAGPPALMALGGFVWARRRKAATAA